MYEKLDLTEQSFTWTEYITNARADPSFMNIFFSGWGPDYFETFNMIDPLVNPGSTANYAQVDIAEINAYLALAAAETNEAQRYLYYEKLQYLIHDKYYIHMPLEYNLLYVVHTENLKDFPYNINNDLHFYPCKWNKTTPGYFRLDSDANSPDDDGKFNLIWDASALADNYSIYHSNSSITLIDNSVTEIASGIINLSYPISGLSSGSWNYMVVAFNEDGNKNSNSLNVISELVAPPGNFTLSTNAGNPDSDGTFNLLWTVSNSAENYSVYLHEGYITEINTSVILLQDGVISNSYAVIGLNDGSYFFKIIAYSKYGNGESNCINVQVQSADSPVNEISFSNYYLLLILISIISVISITKKKIRK